MFFCLRLWCHKIRICKLEWVIRRWETMWKWIQFFETLQFCSKRLRLFGSAVFIFRRALWAINSLILQWNFLESVTLFPPFTWKTPWEGAVMFNKPYYFHVFSHKTLGQIALWQLRFPIVATDSCWLWQSDVECCPRLGNTALVQAETPQLKKQLSLLLNLVLRLCDYKKACQYLRMCFFCLILLHNSCCRGKSTAASGQATNHIYCISRLFYLGKHAAHGSKNQRGSRFFSGRRRRPLMQPKNIERWVLGRLPLTPG